MFNGSFIFYALTTSTSLRKKGPYSELFWSVFSRIWTEEGERDPMRENADQNNSEYGHFSRSYNHHYKQYPVNFFREATI